MSGDLESPANASPGTGHATVIYDDALHTLSVDATFNGLTGNTTAAHIHGPTVTAYANNAAVITTTPTFSGFPVGVTSGTYFNTLDLTLTSSYTASFIAANGGTPASAEIALAAAMLAGKAYFNIHSSTFPGGEIRDFLHLVSEFKACTWSGHAELGFQVASGAVYRVQATTNLRVSSGWTNLTPVLTNHTTGLISYTDTNSAAFPARMYRVGPP